MSVQPFDECSVLIPSATLEDFPVGGNDSDARSLLAGWTVLWHPLLLARAEQVPSWYRADAPPTPDGPRIIVVPDASLEQVPSDYRRKCDANPACRWVTGADRTAMLAALELSDDDPATAPITHDGRTLAVEDFFAAGYLSLQIQIMTRRLRYTSNLDEIYLQSRIVAAAQAFLNRQGQATAEALHDVFDCLSEERDHYFSTDPHLIDLTLLTPQVLEEAIRSGWCQRLKSDSGSSDESSGVLPTPRNVLIDGAVAAAMSEADREGSDLYEPFRSLLQQGTVGWAGGGPSGTPVTAGPVKPEATAEPTVDALTIRQATRQLEREMELVEAAVGARPTVYGRLSGITPADLLPKLASLGYRGVIPMDFVAGTGHGEEAKVLVPAGNSEIEALTAKPIDAASDRAFLSLGAVLGESIDSGEIATGLLVHWPDRVCDSFLDLCRAATWCLALGKLWKLDRYFREGERPYHTGTLEAISKQAAMALADQIDAPDGPGLTELADQFREGLRQEVRRTSRSIATLAKPALLEDVDSDPESTPEQVADALRSALGIRPSGASATDAVDDVLSFNPHSVPLREQTVLSGGAPANSDYVYHVTGLDGTRCGVTYDLPAMGFTRVGASEPVRRPGLLQRLRSGNKQLAEDAVLKNEFMAVSISDTAGGIAGVYSASRGNRLSMKLVAVVDGTDDLEMVCEKVRITHSDALSGSIETTGTLRHKNTTLASYRLTFRLARGSRLLDVEGEIRTTADAAKAAGSGGLWKNYVAVRTAVAEEGSIVRSLVRDKVHRSSARRLVAPLGVLIDEAEKQTLVAGHGLPLHRRVGDRFVDTLVGRLAHRAASTDSPDQAGGSAKQASETLTFRMTYAFDAPNPVALARSCIAPPIRLAVGKESGPPKNDQAWLVHLSSKDVIITDIRTRRRDDGKLAAQLQVVQTRPKHANVSLQFCNFAVAAFLLDDAGLNRSLEELPEDVRCSDGVVSLSLGGHQAVELVVVFDV
ncbi:hypothetical protein [Roseiconus nitratireducens]|uniref:hypothetical protein n=1 Tax=Roseiconus nitratireducens TaxID=2605748 RepID=UPI00191BF51E|nr:hypothetical protein [Roseiconus nitratireducens]